jgi:hypothetical protein
MALLPAAGLLAVTAFIGVPDTPGRVSLVAAMESMLATVVLMALPLMAIAWADGFYPKGSFGRLASGSVLAVAMGVWLALLLWGSGLKQAFVDMGMDLDLDRVFVLVILIAVFISIHPAFEFIDERKHWRKSIGAKVKISMPKVKSWFLDIDPRLGKLQNGNYSAVYAYIRFLVMPTFVLVFMEWLLVKMNPHAKDAFLSSIELMFVTIVVFGVAMVLMRFARGFFPSGSLGRAAFGMLGIPVMFVFAGAIFIDSGIREPLAQNHMILDMPSVLLLVFVYITYAVVIELAEIADNRRRWHKAIRVPVRPFLFEDDYGPVHDFNPRYASFVKGAKGGRSTLSKYLFRRILLLLLVEALLLGLFYQFNSYEADQAAAYIASGVEQRIPVLLSITVALALAVFFQTSYRKGSFARLALTGAVSGLSILWSFSFIGFISNSLKSHYVSDLSFFLPGGFLGTIAMFFMIVFMFIAGVKLILAVISYGRHRDDYLDWRKGMLRDESIVGELPPVKDVRTAALASKSVEPGV